MSRAGSLGLAQRPEKRRTELPLGRERSRLGAEGEGKGRGERERGHEEGGSPWARGHAPGKRGGTRGAEDPDTREEIPDLPPGAENAERPRPRALCPAAVRTGPAPRRLPPASLPSLSPAARYPAVAALTSGCT